MPNGMSQDEYFRWLERIGNEGAAREAARNAPSSSSDGGPLWWIFVAIGALWIAAKILQWTGFINDKGAPPPDQTAIPTPPTPPVPPIVGPGGIRRANPRRGRSVRHRST